MNWPGVEPYETRVIAPWIGRDGRYPEIEVGQPVGGIIMHGWARETEARRTPQPATAQGRSLRGYATKWNHVFERHGHLYAFGRGCFARSLTDNSTIRFLVEHRESELVATTADCLELCQDDEGLKFHLHLRDDDSSRRVADLVESGAKTGMSLGAGFADMIYDEIEIDGSDIRMVRDARLNEISLVEYGAVEESYCRLVDHDSARSIREDSDRGGLARDRASDQVIRALSELKENLYEAFGG